MSLNQSIGSQGEEMARLFLQKKRCRVLRSNYETDFGEIDIIARDPKGVLLFVEVKAISENSEYNPESHFDSRKREKVARLAQDFCARYPYYIDETIGWRVDLVALTLFDKQDPLIFSSWKIRHYENALG